ARRPRAHPPTGRSPPRPRESSSSALSRSRRSVRGVGEMREEPELVTERRRAEPARPRHVEHGAVRPGPLHLDVPLSLRFDAARLPSVARATRARRRELLRDRVEAVDPGEALAALDSRRRIILEREDREVDVAVREKDAARAGIVHLADFLHTERL